MKLNLIDIIIGLQWGDEGKGKVTNAICGGYDFVCRFNGGPNAGHTIYIDDKKYKTHLIPSGVFKHKPSIIGPNCVLNVEDFLKEINYLRQNKFDTSLVKVSPNVHIIQKRHIWYDKIFLKRKLGTTGKGIAPAYADKMIRRGKLAKDILNKEYLWDGNLFGNVLCEGAQSVWLDINHGAYPFVTSSETLPYSACSLGFSPKKINSIIGVAKVYDTKSGRDPLFPETLWKDKNLLKLIQLGKEYGTTTGRRRLANWLRLDHLIKAIKISGVNKIIFNKCDVLEELDIYKIYIGEHIKSFSSLEDMKLFISNYINKCSEDPIEIIFSGDKANI